MAPKASMSLLFHPKKTAKKEQPAPARNPSSPSPRPASTPAKEDEDELKLPDGPYQEFRLLSSALNGWKYDVMKFESRKPVDISKWTPPIKLNRKDLRRDEPSGAGAPEAVKPMVGLDGKPVIGADGRVVMVDAENRPIHSTDGAASGSKDKGKAAANNAKKRFQKKTKQVFLVSDETRQLRREERYPWVMEDSSQEQNELWIGQMEEVKKAETHAFFMPAANDIFKFVPAHRWYKFQKKLKHDFPTDTANVESLYTLSQKRDPQAFLTSRKGTVSAATAAMFKAEAEGRTISIGSSLVHNAGQSLGPGGRKLKTVDSGVDGLFDDDEDGDAKRRREKEYGGEGDMDEQLYEEEFADDDEAMQVDDNDEEAKEVEERLKKEYRAANKQGDTGVDDDEDEEPDTGVTKQEKAMQKLIRNREGNDAYESDEEKNPYASSDEEEEEELPVPTGPAIQPQPESRSQTPKAPTPRPQVNGGTDSRATSPAASPSLGGHSVLAKRATSPKPPKPKTSNGSRANSPLGSRASSPVAGSRATSPMGTVSNGARAESPGIQKVNNKRKAEESPSSTNVSHAPNGGNQAPKVKKRKATAHDSSPLSSAELEAMLVGWLMNTPNATTRDCIHHFTRYLTDAEKKSEFSNLVKKVAQLKGGVLVLRQQTAESSPAPA
ncbi:hypothetical protein BDQ12DRAFT_675125 [Crucibulum laeve]|uniref:Uncharacterized protein n=1 Tax=Crucibulum laeve TaxID=68775 RepID=A0A5C3MDJ3_9AGAR|nr:hypothetical protein BDQ12DRAFT_675125 [Crucibulum laeve]